MLAVKRYELTLPKKILLVFIMTLFLIAAGFGLFLYLSVSGQNRLEVEQQVLSRLQASKYQIISSIETMTNSAQLVASDANLITFLNKQSIPETLELLQFRETTLFYIENIINITPHISSLYIITDRPSVLPIRSIIKNEAPIMEHQMIRRFLEDSYFGMWLIDEGEKDPFSCLDEKDGQWVRFIAKIQGYESRPAGIVAISMPFDSFLGRYESPISSGETILLLQKDRIITSGPVHHAQIQALLRKEGMLPLLEPVENYAHFSARIKHEAWQYGITWIPEVESHLIVGVQDSNLDRDRVKLAIIILSGIVLFTVLISILARSIIFRMMNRLETMVDAMRHIEEGQWELSFDTSGQDELSEIALHFQAMLDRINKLINTVVEKQLAARNAHLKAFFNQINAHFLYNTLENIRMLAEVRSQLDISDAISSLGRFIRYSIHWERAFVPIKEEISHIQDYLHIINVRRENPIQLRFSEYQENQHEIPKMILQPLVENCVIHGFSRDLPGAVITITTGMSGSIYRIEVEDNGKGMEEQDFVELSEKLSGKENNEEGKVFVSEHIGLANVDKRLKLYYGAKSRLTLEKGVKKGIRVIVCLEPEGEKENGFHPDR